MFYHYLSVRLMYRKGKEKGRDGKREGGRGERERGSESSKLKDHSLSLSFDSTVIYRITYYDRCDSTLI